MTNIKEKICKKVSALSMTAKTGITTAVITTACAMPAFAAEGDTSAAGIAINFDIKQMFTFANIIIEALMPVVYITAGLGIGFLIINSLKAAFR